MALRENKMHKPENLRPRHCVCVKQIPLEGRCLLCGKSILERDPWTGQPIIEADGR